MQNGVTPESVAIGAGAALSAPVRLYGAGITRVNMPSTWTAAVLTFLVSEDGQTYYDLYDSAGNEISATVAASQSIVMDPTVFGLGFDYVQLRSGTLATPVNQVAAATLQLVTRPI